MMLGADIRFCAPDTDISVMEMRWGLIPDVAGMALLRGLVREDRLWEIIFTGRRYTGAEAAEIGLVTHLASDNHAEAVRAGRDKRVAVFKN